MAYQTDSSGHPDNGNGLVFTDDEIVRGIMVDKFSPNLVIIVPCDLFMEDIGVNTDAR